MAPTEGRVARPERRWGCRRGTPTKFGLLRIDSASVWCLPLVSRSNYRPLLLATYKMLTFGLQLQNIRHVIKKESKNKVLSRAHRAALISSLSRTPAEAARPKIRG